MGLKTFLTLSITAAALTMAGCKDTNRPLSYEKGVYQGKQDKPLTEEQLNTLRQRGKRTFQ